MATPWSPTIRLFLRDTWIRWSFGVSLVVFLATVVGLFVFFPNGESVPLHYNTYFGIDFVGPAWQIYLLPVSGLVLTILNAILSLWIWRRDRVVSYFLASGTLVVAIIIAAASLLAAILNLI